MATTSSPVREAEVRERPFAAAAINAVNSTAEAQLTPWWHPMQVLLHLNGVMLTILQSCMSLGMPVGTWVGTRLSPMIGDKATLMIGGTFFYGSMPATAICAYWFHNPYLVALGVLGFGAGTGIHDTAQSNYNSAVEKPGKKRNMVLGAAVFSIGAMLSSLAAELLLKHHVTMVVHMTAEAVVTLTVLGAIALVLPPMRGGMYLPAWNAKQAREQAERNEAKPAEGDGTASEPAPKKGLVALFVYLGMLGWYGLRVLAARLGWNRVRPAARPPRPAALTEIGRATLPIALLGGCGALVMGIFYTQTGLMFQAFGASLADSTWGVTVFSGAQAVVQLTVYFLPRLSPRVIVPIGSLVSLVGAALCGLVLFHVFDWHMAIVACGFIGAGMATLAPMARSVVGQLFPEDRAAALGVVLQFNHSGIALAPLFALPFKYVLGNAAGPITLMVILALVVALFGWKVFHITDKSVGAS